MNYKTLIIGLITCSLLIAALITTRGDLAFMMLPFLFYLGMGVLKAPAADRLRLTAWRSVGRIESDDISTVEVTIDLQNEGSEALCLLMSESLQTGMQLLEGHLSRWLVLAPGEKEHMQYSCQATRGHFTWKTVQVVASDPLNLVEAVLNLPAAAEFQLQPRMKKYKPIQMHPRSTLHSPGSIPARLGGSGTDFWGIREYHPGDPLRRLDWRQTARHPHKFFTKEFEQEEIAEVCLILDARRKVELRVGPDSLFEHGLGVTASLAEMFLHQGHRVSLMVYGEGMLQAYPGYGKVQLHRIMDILSKARIGPEGASLDNLEYLPVRMFPSHALVILVSPLASNDWSLFPRLRAMGYQVLLISPDPVEFAARTLPEDNITRMAIRAAQIDRGIKLRNITQLQIQVIDWCVGQPLLPLIRKALSRPSGVRR
jgi:uncharacterized protein (DUF58 family)